MQRQQEQAQKQIFEKQSNDIYTESIYSQSQASKTTSKDFSKQRFKYSIISQQSSNQILQVVLMPNQTVYHNGQIIYSNQSQPQSMLKYLLRQVQKKISYFTCNKHFNLIKLYNQGIDVNYYGIRSQRGGGKIIVFDSQVYDHYFYIRKDKVLVSNLSKENGLFKTHQKVSDFIRGKPKQQFKDIDAFYIVQAQINSLIIQKDLGKNQHFSCKLKNLIAFSNNVHVLGKGKGEWVSFQGPGWVFVENKPQLGYENTKGMGYLKIFCFGYIFLSLIGTIFQMGMFMQGIQFQ